MGQGNCSKNEEATVAVVKIRSVSIDLTRCRMPKEGLSLNAKETNEAMTRKETTARDDVVNKIVSWDNFYQFENIDKLKLILEPFPVEYDMILEMFQDEEAFNPLSIQLPTEVQLTRNTDSALRDYYKFCSGLKHLKSQAMYYTHNLADSLVNTNRTGEFSFNDDTKKVEGKTVGRRRETRSTDRTKEHVQTSLFQEDAYYSSMQEVGLSGRFFDGDTNPTLDQKNERNDKDWEGDESTLKKKRKKGRKLLTQEEISQRFDSEETKSIAHGRNASLNGNDLCEKGGEEGVEGRGRKKISYETKPKESHSMDRFLNRGLEKSKNVLDEKEQKRKRGPAAAAFIHMAQIQKVEDIVEVSDDNDLFSQLSALNKMGTSVTTTTYRSQPSPPPARTASTGGECPLCQRRFSSVEELERHAALCDGPDDADADDEKVTSCDICHNQMPLAELEEHARDCWNKMEKRQKIRDAAEKRKAGMKRAEDYLEKRRP